MAAAASLTPSYVPLPPRAALEHALGVVAFESAPEATGDLGVPCLEVTAPVLAGPARVCELWHGALAGESGVLRGVRYRRSEELLFGCLSMAERERAGSSTDRPTPLEEATLEAYSDLYATLERLEFPHLVRVWNYFADINAHRDGSERYWQFNAARHAAMRAAGQSVNGQAPAACALGLDSGSPLRIYFLASRTAPILLENPRQVSAYHYPPEYGPRSPIFSRASVLEQTHGATLFISGTSSIVGHRTVHAGDVRAQTRETLDNIETLIAEANRAIGGHFAPQALCYKAYVRHAHHLPAVRAEMSALLGPAAQVLYLQAEICRADLLIEIEAAGTAS